MTIRKQKSDYIKNLKEDMVRRKAKSLIISSLNKLETKKLIKILAISGIQEIPTSTDEICPNYIYAMHNNLSGIKGTCKCEGNLV